MRFIVTSYIIISLLCALTLSWSVLKDKHDLTLGRLLVNLFVGSIPVVGIIWAICSLLFQRVYHGHRTIFDAVIFKA